MSITNIKKCFEILKADESSLTWIETEVSNLLYAIAEHLIQSGKKRAKPKEEGANREPPAGWLKVCDFVKSQKIFPYGTVSGLISRDKAFKEKYTFRTTGNMYIDPIAANEYLRKSKKIQNMLARFNHS